MHLNAFGRHKLRNYVEWFQCTYISIKFMKICQLIIYYPKVSEYTFTQCDIQTKYFSNILQTKNGENKASYLVE